MKTMFLLLLLFLNNPFHPKEKPDSPLMSFAKNKGIELVELEDGLPNNSGFIKVTFPVKDTLEALKTFNFLKKIGWKHLGFVTNATEDKIGVYPQAFQSVGSEGEYYFDNEHLYAMHKGTLYLYEDSLSKILQKVEEYAKGNDGKISEYQITSIMEFPGMKKMKQVCFDLKSKGQ